MIKSALLFSVLFSTSAMAQDLPAVFSAKDVAANDVLNIRSAPDAKSDVLDTLAPNAKGIEILELSEDGKWGKTQVIEGEGWISMRYLAAMPVANDGKIARPLQCFGNEPGWSFHLKADETLWTTTEDPSIALKVEEDLLGQGGGFMQASAEDGRIFRLMTRPVACNDGMADIPYGYAAQLFISQNGDSRMYSGCCTMSHR